MIKKLAMRPFILALALAKTLRAIFRRAFGRCPECGRKLEYLYLLVDRVFVEDVCNEGHYLEIFIFPNLTKVLTYKGEDALSRINTLVEICERQTAVREWLTARTVSRTLN